MADTKNYGLSGLSTDVELGIDGPRIKVDGTAVAFRDTADTAYAQIKAATPTTDDAVVTKGYLERTANVIVSNQIDGTSPPAVINGVVYVCTTTGGVYTEKNLYRGEGGSWVELVPFAGMRMAVTVPLTGGNIEFLGDTIYLWDGDTSNWINIGPYVPVVAGKLVKSERVDLAFNTASPLNIGASVPVGARPFMVIVNVTQTFNGTPRSRVEIGDALDTNRLAEQSESNLSKLGTYVVNCYHNYASATQLIATYTANGATQGTAQIEVVYSTAP